MTHDYKEGPYSTGTLIERLEEMCGRGEDYGVLLGRDVWPDDVLEAIERIKQLEAALRELSCKCTSNCDWERGDICPSWIARKALEGKNDRPHSPAP